MVNIHILRNLSYSSAIQLLLQEGYLAAGHTEETNDTCNKLFLYPYLLKLGQKTIDLIYYAEYCNLETDDEYNDGRMTWVAGRTDWIRSRQSFILL